MIERPQAFFDRTRITESGKIFPLDVVVEYRRIDQIPLENKVRMIMLYPNWRRDILTLEELGELVWYFDEKDSQHISWQLTQNGKSRRLKQVAQAYISIGSASLARVWKETIKIEGMIATLQREEKLPPLIIVEGNRYPDSPDSSFIDGVHRSLAMMIIAIEAPDNNFAIDVLVGRKAGLLKRATRKFGLT